MAIPRLQRLAALSDEDLMEKARGGHTRAFGVIFDRHGSAAFSLAYRMSGSRSVAEDIVQEAFLSLWRSAAGYERARASVRSWVLCAVHNRAVDHFRRGQSKYGTTVADDGITERLESPVRTDVEAERLDEAQRVRQAMTLVPQDQRRVIELAYFGGFSQTEIAELLGIPLGTVKGRMRLGLGRMRAALGEDAVAI